MARRKRKPGDYLPGQALTRGGAPSRLEEDIRQVFRGDIIDHGDLQGLADDDHPQYAAIAQTETITGAWDFGTGRLRLTRGLDASKPAIGNIEGDVFWGTDTDKFYIWNGAAWQEVGTFLSAFNDAEGDPIDVDATAAADGVSTSPARRDHRHHLGAHAATHQNGGADEISVAGLSGELADPQPPKAHAASHKHGGSDEIAVAVPAVNGIPKAELGIDTLHRGWLAEFLPSGPTAAKGAVPNPGAVAGTTKFLREDATWQIPDHGTLTGLGDDDHAQYLTHQRGLRLVAAGI